MTTSDERYRSIQLARDLLKDLCSPRMTPRVPAIVRQRALAVLRHYPGDYEMEIIARDAATLLNSKSHNTFNI